MMKNQKYFIGAMFVIATAGSILISRRADREEASVSKIDRPTFAREEEIAPGTLEKLTPGRNPARISTTELSKLRSTFPNALTVREEVEKDPHRTPASLLAFARTMGPLLDKAYKDAGNADLLLTELHDCAIDKDVARSARALCVSNAEKLSRKHPEMKEKSEEIRENAGPEVLRLMERKKRFTR